MRSSLDKAGSRIDECNRDIIDHESETRGASPVAGKLGPGHRDRTPGTQNRDVSLWHEQLSRGSIARLANTSVASDECFQ
jgi:hypothetical protein